MVKSVLFKMEIEGSGIVNFDSNDQKWLWNRQNGVQKCRYDNTSFGKARYYKPDSSSGEDKTLERVPVISADCIRHAMYEDNMFIHMPNVMHDDGMLLRLIASPAFLERGYLFARDTKSIWKRKSPFAISYAKGTTYSVPALEKYSNSQPKNGIKKSEDKAETSFFEREIRGDSKYECYGVIDVQELGFISISDIHDRLSFDADYTEEYRSHLSNKLGSEVPEAAFYSKKHDLYDIPEYGIQLTQDQVKFLTLDILKRLARFNVFRAVTGNAKTVSLKVKFVNDPLTDLASNDDGWVDVLLDNKLNLSVLSDVAFSCGYEAVDLSEEAEKKIKGYKEKFGYKAPVEEEKPKKGTKS